MTRLHVGCRLLPTSMDISMFTGFVRIIQHISTLWYQIHKITQIPIHHNSISNTTSNIIKPYVICPKKCRARAARGRTGDLVALSKLLRLPTHPDAARSSDGITALLSASCGAPAWHAMAMACRNSQDEMRRDETRCMEEFSWMRSCRSVCVIMCHLMSSPQSYFKNMQCRADVIYHDLVCMLMELAKSCKCFCILLSHGMFSNALSVLLRLRNSWAHCM